MAITDAGTLKPVSEFTPAERWWCGGEDCDGRTTDPRVHLYDSLRLAGGALPADLLADRAAGRG